MDSIELLFAGAIAAVLAMGAFVLFFLMRRASDLMETTRRQQADALGHVQKCAALQQEAIDLARESIALQREANRLLAELLARDDEASE